MLPRQIAERPIRVALSGGGFRAALFSLGSVLYLVDAQCNNRVTEIRSVSGASILNGLLAQSGDVRTMKVSDIDEVAVTLLRTVTRRGLLLSSWATVVYLAMSGVGIFGLILAIATGWPVDLTAWQAMLAALALGGLLMSRGAVIAALLSRQFFRGVDGPTRLGEVVSPVRHVFCATDLNSAESANFSAGADDSTITTGMGTVRAPSFRLARAVRASAAFPGLVPPARMPLRLLGLGWRHRVQRQPAALRHMAGRQDGRPGRVLHLADGGVSNNLATAEARTRDDIDHLVLVVDASAPLSTARLPGLSIPYLSEVASLRRSMAVLYANTVEPRIAELETRGALTLARGDVAGPTGDFPIVVRVTDNTSDGVRRIRRMRERAGMPPAEDQAASDLLDLTRRYWNEASRYLRDHYHLKVMAVRSSSVPTTFGRVDRAEAMGLMLHGYLATMIALANSLGTPCGPIQFERFERLVDLHAGGGPGFRSGSVSWGDDGL